MEEARVQLGTTREEGFEKMEKRREAHNIMNKAEIHKGWRARRRPSWPEQGF